MKLTHILAALAITAFTATLSVPLHAQETDVTSEQASEQTALEMRAEQVVAIVNAELGPEAVFTDDFLADVPPAQLAAISQQLTGQFGAALSVESLDSPDSTRSTLAIRMERAIARGGIAINPNDDNRISELLFQTFEPIGDDASKIEADLSALPGDVSWWFGRLDGDKPPLMANEWDEQMALGSTFKLYVLAALAREVSQGKRDWSDVVTLGRLRSFPSGMTQDWPADAPVTLHTLASLMISISDNTATDTLIDILGRDTIYQTLVDSGHREAELNNPFLKTREMFLLKAGPVNRMEAFQSGDAGTRGQILAGIETPEVSENTVKTAFSNGPTALDIEWFASARDLGNLLRFMRETADKEAFAIMAINHSVTPGVREEWAYVGYKGGSEPGVLNLTWLLTDSEGRDHALVLSWSNPDANLDQTSLELIAQRILALTD